MRRRAPATLQATFTHDCTGLTCSFDATNSTGELVPCNFQCTGLGTSLDELAGVQGIDAAWVQLPEGAADQTFQVESSGGDPDVVFYTDIDCQQDPTPFMEAGREGGIVSSGAVCARLTEFLGPASEIIFSISNATGSRQRDPEHHRARKPDAPPRHTWPPRRDVDVAATADTRRDTAEDVRQERASP